MDKQLNMDLPMNYIQIPYLEIQYINP